MLRKWSNEPSFGASHLIVPCSAVLNIIRVLWPPLHILVESVATYKDPYRKAVFKGAPRLDKRQLLSRTRLQKISGDVIRTLKNGGNVKLPTKSSFPVQKRICSEGPAAPSTRILNRPVPLNRLRIFLKCCEQTLERCMRLALPSAYMQYLILPIK